MNCNDPADNCAVIPQRRTEQSGIATGRWDQSEQHLDGSGLAGAVGAQKTEHFPARDLQPQIGNGDPSTELLAQGARLDGDVRHREVTGYWVDRAISNTSGCVGDEYLNPSRRSWPVDTSAPSIMRSPAAGASDQASRWGADQVRRSGEVR